MSALNSAPLIEGASASHADDCPPTSVCGGGPGEFGAGSDTFVNIPKGTVVGLDVFENDQFPDGTSVTWSENVGRVWYAGDCHPRPCFGYFVDEDYQGYEDSFSYTLTAPDYKTSTATVIVRFS